MNSAARLSPSTDQCRLAGLALVGALWALAPRASSSAALQTTPETQATAQEQKLTAVGFEQSGASFGSAADVSENTVVVGAPDEDDSGLQDVGAIYVFERDEHGTPDDFSDDTWSPPLRVQNPTPANFDYFGNAVAIERDVMVVGAPGDDATGAADAGAAHIFHRSGTGWCLVASVRASEFAAFDLFGIAVAASADTIVVGASADDTSAGVGAGSAWVFVRNDQGTPAPCDDTYALQQQLLNALPGATASDSFGERVAIHGDIAVVGAYRDDIAADSDQGSASIFRRSGVTWTGQGLTAPDGAASDRFGWDVAVYRSTVVVGAIADDHAATDAGSAYVFEPSAGSIFGFVQKLTAPDPAASDYFGFDLDVDGRTIVVGAYSANFPAQGDSGAAYVFRRGASGNFVQAEKVNPCDGAVVDLFGAPVRIAGSTLVVGAEGNDFFGGTAFGAAYVFRLTSPEPFASVCYGDGGSASARCPCANNSVLGRKQGCRNSTGRGARLFALGTADVTLDDLQMSTCNLPLTTPTLLFAGSVALNGGAGSIFGDGLGCAGGPGVKRLGVRVSSTTGSAYFGPGLRPLGLWNPGDTRYFQAWFRNSLGGPCGLGFNLTEAVQVTFR